MEYLGASIIVILFIILVKLLKLFENSVAVVGISKSALSDIRNPNLSDEVKERQIQGYSIQLFKFFFILTISAILAVGVPVGFVWILNCAALLSFHDVIEVTLSPMFLVASSVFAAGSFWIMAKAKKS